MPNGFKIEGSRDISQAVHEDSKHKMVSRFLQNLGRLYTVVVVVGILNFLLFIAGTFYLGDDAVNGKVEGGRYYLWGYHNGKKKYTEVSQAVFDYSKWRVYSVMVTWPLMFLAVLRLIECANPLGRFERSNGASQPKLDRLTNAGHTVTILPPTREATPS